MLDFEKWTVRQCMKNDSHDVYVKFCVCWKIVADKIYAEIIYKKELQILLMIGDDIADWK